MASELDKKVDEYAVPIMKVRPSNVNQYISNWYSLYYTGLRKTQTAVVTLAAAQSGSKSKTFPITFVNHHDAQLVGATRVYGDDSLTIPDVLSVAHSSAEAHYGNVSGGEANSFTPPISVGHAAEIL